MLAGRGGGLCSSADSLVEPAFLFTLCVGEIEHQGVEEVGVTDQEAEIVVCPVSFTSELLPGGMGEIVCLSDAHFLMLTATNEGIKVGAGRSSEGGCRSRVHGGPGQLFE